MGHNKFGNAVIKGAGVALGCYLMSEAIETVRNPVKRKKLKNGMKNIKDAFDKKTES